MERDEKLIQIGQVIEKIEVSKSYGSFFYTGILLPDDDPEWIRVNTIKGEKLRFRKEQIQQREEIGTFS